MREKRIKIKKQISLQEFLIVTVLLGALLCSLLYVIFVLDFVSASTKHNCWGAIGLIVFIISSSFSSFTSKLDYLSDIYISDQTIRLVYKNSHRISRNVLISKDNIKAFNIELDVQIVKDSRYQQQRVTSKLLIYLNEGRNIYLNLMPPLSLVPSDYKFVFNILKESSSIPNFNLKVTSNSDFVKAQIDYWQRFGKELPFLLRLKMIFNYSSKGEKSLLIFLLIIIVLFIVMSGVCIYANTPPLLSPSEKQYIEQVDIAYDYYKNSNYEMALLNLDKAKTYDSKDPYLYYQYAKIYKRKRNYETAYEYAKEGIANLKNKHTYNKKYKILPSSDDVNLYEILGDCADKLQKYEIGVEAYTYVIKHSSYKYLDTYFSRGRMYYKLGMYNEAKTDFYKHQDIIYKYISDQETSKFKFKYPEYTDEDLQNIQKWIFACEKNLQYSL